MLKPWRITIDTNPDECNLNCIMCDTHSIYSVKREHRKSMDREFLEEIINQILELEVREIIPTTMGEPLLYKHFDLFVEKLNSSKTKLNLTTNGTILNQWQNRLLPVLSDIKISINAIDSQLNEKIMIGDNTKKKLEIIENFVKQRNMSFPKVSITLQVTFLKTNLLELENIIKFGIKMGIDRIKGHHLWVNSSQMQDENLLQSSKTVEEWNSFVDNLEKYKSQIKLVNFEKYISSNVFIPKSYNCPFLGNELWIDFNGDFNICCAPSEKRKSLGSWGNIESRSIQDVFNSKEYQKLLVEYKNMDICKICPLRKTN